MHSNKNKAQLIQELKVLEDKLLKIESQQKPDEDFETLFAYSLDLMAVLDKNFTYKAVNSAYCNAFGFQSPDQLIGRSVAEIIGQSFFDSTIKPRINSCLSGDSTNHQLWFDFPQLGKRYIDVTYSPYKGSGDNAGFIVLARDITDRFLKDQSILENEYRLNMATEFLNVGTWEFDLLTNQLTWSDEVYRIFGLVKNELAINFDTFLASVHPDDRQKVEQAYKSSLKSNLDGYHIEHRIVLAKNQEVRYLKEKCQHFRNDKGEIIRSIGMVHDITDIKVASLTAEQNEEYFRNIIEASPVPYALNDDDGNITYLNPAFIEAFGYDTSDIQTLNDWWPLAYPDRKYQQLIIDTWQNNLEVSLEQKKDFVPIEINIRCKDGSFRTVLASAAQLSKQKGGEHLVILYDVTDIKEAEEKINQQKNEQIKILDSMVEAVITIDESGMIQTFNRSAENIFEYTEKEIIGQNIRNLMPESYSANHNSYINNYLSDNKPKVIGIGREVNGKSKSGRVFPIRLSVAELSTSENEKRRFIGTCQDMTLQKQQDEYVQQSQKMDAIGQLTGGIAHDFNNMLSVILGYSELIERLNVQGESHKNHIKQIIIAGKRAKNLTNKLLSFARKKQFKQEDTDVNLLLKDSEDMLAKTLMSKVELQLDLNSELVNVKLDKSSLIDAVINLSINARHSMPSGGSFRISTEVQRIEDYSNKISNLQPGDYLKVSFSDTGIGMDEATRLKMFEPFFSTKGEAGTGLGMSQVYGFVKQSNGAIYVDSQIGVGTTIELYFPVCERSEAETSSAQAAENKKNELKVERSILVVDDEPALLSMTSEFLSSDGYCVYSTDNGKDALTILSKHKIDMLVSDVVMPKMDGFELAKKVSETFPEVLIQLVSGYSQSNIATQDDCKWQKSILEKPFDSKALLSCVHQMFMEVRN